MEKTTYKVVFFDFDGVLAESVNVKTAAFSTLYLRYGPDIARRVVEHHLANGGMSRFEKIRHYHEHFVGEDLTPAVEQDLLRRFSELVETAVVDAKWVPGAKECLRNLFGRAALYVVSATPQLEMQRIIARRDMAQYFAGVFGSPTTKAEHISAVLERTKVDPVDAVMIGDALADLDAARKAGIDFIGRVAPKSLVQFGQETQTVADLSELNL